jgi:hypothetical protein
VPYNMQQGGVWPGQNMHTSPNSPESPYMSLPGQGGSHHSPAGQHSVGHSVSGAQWSSPAQPYGQPYGQPQVWQMPWQSAHQPPVQNCQFPGQMPGPTQQSAMWQGMAAPSRPFLSPGGAGVATPAAYPGAPLPGGGYLSASAPGSSYPGGPAAGNCPAGYGIQNPAAWPGHPGVPQAPGTDAKEHHLPIV